MGSRFRRIISTATENASTSGWEIADLKMNVIKSHVNLARKLAGKE